MSSHCWPVPGHTPPHPQCTVIKPVGSNEDHYSTGFPGTVVSDKVIFEQRPEGSGRMSCATIWEEGFQALSPECGWVLKQQQESRWLKQKEWGCKTEGREGWGGGKEHGNFWGSQYLFPSQSFTLGELWPGEITLDFQLENLVGIRFSRLIGLSFPAQKMRIMKPISQGYCAY